MIKGACRILGIFTYHGSQNTAALDRKRRLWPICLRMRAAHAPRPARLQKIRAAGVSLPLLAKEFIVDAYQLMKARAAGADAALLIAAVLPNADLEYFCKAAAALGMTCLVEVHTIAELARVLRVPGIDGHILGINNRDLGTFKVRRLRARLVRVLQLEAQLGLRPGR